MIKICVLAFLTFSVSVHAHSESIENLSAHPRWLSLVHYKKSWLGGHRSVVRSPEFFFSAVGRSDPAAELSATIEAMLASPAENMNSNTHAQCRFPARRRWLLQKNAFVDKVLPKVDCEDFQKFSFNRSVSSISLIFATGYLSNPASYFGHPLIKFNLPREKVSTHLLDISVNYGAITPPKENPFVYAAKGLLGGYHATFSNRQFYYNNHAYGELELRDMWEYELNLTPEEVQDFVEQTWESLGRFFPYYFLSDNCASAVSDMFEDVVGVRLIPRFLPYSFPYTVFDNLTSKRRPDGTALVKSVKLIPSRQTRLTRRFAGLSEVEQEAMRSVAESGARTPAYQALPAEPKRAVIETLFDYYSFLGSVDREDGKFKELRRELVADRLELPSGSYALELGDAIQPPHHGQRPLLTRLGARSSQEFGTLGEFQFRFAYYDLLALDHGRPTNSDVRGMDFIFNFDDQRGWLRQADLFSLQTMNLSQTGLPGDGGYAWKFKLGWETVDLDCQDCLAFRLETGIGKAYAVGLRGSSVFAMIDGRAQSSENGSGHLGVTPHLGALISPLRGDVWKAYLFAGYRDYVDTTDDGDWILRFENRFGTSRSWDVRVVYEKHVDERWGLSYSRYW